MAAGKMGFLNAERALFAALALLLASFVFRTLSVKPMPPLPKAPRQEGVRVAEGYVEPAVELRLQAVPEFWSQGARNPFAPAYDSLRVVAAKVTALMKFSRSSGTALVDIEYRILPHPVSKFQFLLPPGVELVRADGSGVVNRSKPDKKDVGPDGTQYTVRLGTPVVDKKYMLHLKLAWRQKAGDQVLRVPEILLPDATHERGVIALAASRNMPVRVQAVNNVTAVPIESLPANLTRNRLLPHQRCFAAFSYRAHPYSIRLSVSTRVAKRGNGGNGGKRGSEGIKPPPPPPPRRRLPPPPPPPKRGTTPIQITGKNGPTWRLPFGLTGTVKVGTTRSALLQDASGNIRRLKEGDVALGMTIEKINPTSVILKNEKGQRFKLKGKILQQYEY